MKKRGLNLIVVALSLLLLVGLVTSASAANGTGNSPNGPERTGIVAGQKQNQIALRVVADLTGMDAADVRSLRQEGKSLAAIAKSQGISEQTLINEITASRTATLDQLKADKKITDEQYQNCLTNMQARVKSNIERTTTGPGNGQYQNKRMGGMGQGMGKACGQKSANCPYAENAAK